MVCRDAKVCTPLTQEVGEVARTIDVGQWLIEKGENRALHFQKLSYFGQVWSLVWTGAPLVDDDFQAWTRGPVLPDLYRVLKYNCVDGRIAGADASHVDEVEAEILGAVFQHYGSKVGDVIVEESHDDAWNAARGSIALGQHCSTNLDMTIAVREYTRRAILGDRVPQRPDSLPVRIAGPRTTRHEAQRQDARWSAVHRRLAEA